METENFYQQIQDAIQRGNCDEAKQLIDKLDSAYCRCCSLLEQANDAILVFNVDSLAIIDANNQAEMLLGCPTETIKSKKITDFLPPQDQENVIEEYRSIIKNGQPLRKVISILTNNGARLDVEVSAAEVKFNEVTVIQAIFRDISEQIALRKEAEKRARQLEEAEQLRTEFLAMISHELRTPLNAIIGYNSMLEEEVYGGLNEKQFKAVKRIDKNATRLLSLINQLLELSRLEAGVATVFHEEADLVALVNDVLDDYQVVADEKNIDIQLSHSRKGIKVITDISKVKEIVRQLISNAIKFTHRGTVSIDIQATETEGVVKISDTGAGINPNQREAIFEMFRQGDVYSSRRHDGAGLGLAIVKRLANLIDATISFESELEKGTTFSIHIPAKPVQCDENKAAKQPEAAETPEMPPHRKHAPLKFETAQTILIVDDDPYTVEFLSDFLEHKGGYRVEKAYSGMHAMIHLAQAKPDYLLVDLLMPQINGERVIQYCRELWDDQVQIVVITGKELSPAEQQDITNKVFALIKKGDLTKGHFLETLKSVIPIPCAIDNSVAM